MTLHTRPALKLVLIFISGFIAADYFSLPMRTVCVLASMTTISSFILFCVIKKPSRAADFILFLAVFFTAMYRYQIARDILPENHIAHFTHLKKSIAITGQISDYPVTRDSTAQCEFSVDSLRLSDRRSMSVCGTIILKNLPDSLGLSIDDRLCVIGKLRRPPGERNPGEFDYRKYLKSRSIHGILYPAQIDRLPPGEASHAVQRLVKAGRNYIDAAINRAFDDQNRAVLKGLVLGERGEIDYELKDAYSKTGVIHVLAVSGLHVGFVVMIFSYFFRMFRLPYPVVNILTMISIFWFMIMIGFQPPVVRASTVVILYLTGILLQRRTDSLNLLATAALIILLINPLQLFQPSFQLSFAAVLSILFIFNILNSLTLKLAWRKRLKKIKILDYAMQLLLVSGAVSIGTFPLTIYYFEKFPIIAIVINIIVVPLVGFIIALGFAYIILSMIFWPLAAGVAWLNIRLLNFLNALVQATAQQSYASLPIYGMHLFHIMLVYYFLYLIFNLDMRRYRKILIFSLLICANFYIWRHVVASKGWLQVMFFDVGQGDAALITTPEGHHILIDAGNAYEGFDAGERHILPYLRRAGIRHLDVLLISHADNDHIGGIRFILNHLDVRRIISNGIGTDSEMYTHLRSTIDSLRIGHDIMAAGDRLSLPGGCRFYILHPGAHDRYEDHNNASLTLKMVYQNISFLFTGDVEREGEERLMRFNEMLKSDVLKIAHHGSKTSSSPEILKMVNPRYGVISVGEYNRFRHPSESVLKRLEGQGIEIIRTDINGAVIFRTDGERLLRIR